MSEFTIAASIPEEKAKELLSKAVHLSEGQKEQVWRKYLESQGKAVPIVSGTKNPVGWTSLGGKVSQVDLLKKVASGEIKDLAEAAKMLASSGGLKCRYNPETGTISVKGNGQYPWASLYADQWEKLNAVMGEVMGYIAANKTAIDAAELVGKASKAAKKAA